MTVEHARAHAVPKPWGVADTRPWRDTSDASGQTIGEIWYERSDCVSAVPSLLLKLLFTNQPLSIQVHPADAYARSIGLPNGKTEAWYVLSAAPEAKVAVGLKRRVTAQQLRDSVDDGSISDLVAWQTVKLGDSVLVTAGTIHAIGAGLVIAEIQQRSNATFRLFDHGRGRDLQVESAIAVADPSPPNAGVTPKRLTETRTLLSCNAHFVFERIELAPHSHWCLDAMHETWLLLVHGSASVGSIALTIGDGVFAKADRVHLGVGGAGAAALVAYTGDFVPDLLIRTPMETIL